MRTSRPSSFTFWAGGRRYGKGPLLLEPGGWGHPGASRYWRVHRCFYRSNWLQRLGTVTRGRGARGPRAAVRRVRRSPYRGSPRLHRWAPASRVRSLLVVGVDEALDLGLELGQGFCRRLLAQPLLQCEVVVLDFAPCLGGALSSLPCLKVIPRAASSISMPVAAPVDRGVDRTVV